MSASLTSQVVYTPVTGMQNWYVYPSGALGQPTEPVPNPYVNDIAFASDVRQYNVSFDNTRATYNDFAPDYNEALLPGGGRVDQVTRRPAVPTYGFQPVVFRIRTIFDVTGTAMTDATTASEYTFYAEGDGPGPDLTLWHVTGTDVHYVESIAQASSLNSAGGYNASVGFRTLMKPGETYYLEVASSGGSAQNFKMRVYPSSSYHVGDLRDDARRVVIAGDGGSYYFEDMLNAGFSRSVLDTDDPSDGTIVDATGWFLYRPQHAGHVTMQWGVAPANYPHIGYRVYRQTGTGLVAIGPSDPTAGVFEYDVKDPLTPPTSDQDVYPGDSIYIQYGATTGYQGGTYKGQYYLIRMVGPQSFDTPEDNNDPNGPTDSQPSPALAPQCMSRLDLIRNFSKEIRKPVRIIDETTIQIMPMSGGPVPDGYTSSHADNYYSASEIDTEAGTEALLRLEDSFVSAQGTVDFQDDQPGMIVAGVEPLDKVPFPDSADIPYVLGMSYTFTPTGFSGSLDVVFPNRPNDTRR